MSRQDFRHGGYPSNPRSDYDEVMSRFKAPKPDNALAAKIKTCYRAIVRQLHPDRAGAFTSHEAALWHEAQAAYQRQDLPALELILARCEAGAENAENLNRASLLMQLIRQTQTNLEHLRDKLRYARRDPAWKFSRRKNLDSIRRQVAFDLDDAMVGAKKEFAETRRAMAHLEKQYTQWLSKQKGQAPLAKASPELNSDQNQFAFE